MNIQKAKEYLSRKDLSAHDFKPVFCEVNFHDESKILFRNSIMEIKDDFLFLFTEHYGYHLFHIDEIISARVLDLNYKVINVVVDETFKSVKRGIEQAKQGKLTPLDTSLLPDE